MHDGSMIIGARSRALLAFLLAGVALPAFAQESATPKKNADGTTVLETITVNADVKKGARGYQPVTTGTATRTETPLLDIPQSAMW
ncbi:hypothetical protein [Agrobacterium sp. TS45]|uniref:hypothetical protein n=1 Tax=Agrobacterium sp. TS45 TaxID=477197 RepID=UPI000A8C9D56|nr:hypothetical protein [Agrobacterium sp. TS45]